MSGICDVGDITMLFDDDGDSDLDDFEDIVGGIESVGFVGLVFVFEVLEPSMFSWDVLWSAGEDGDDDEFTDSRPEPTPEPEPEPEPASGTDADDELAPVVSLIESLLTSADKFPTG